MALGEWGGLGVWGVESIGYSVDFETMTIPVAVRNFTGNQSITSSFDSITIPTLINLFTVDEKGDHTVSFEKITIPASIEELTAKQLIFTSGYKAIVSSAFSDFSAHQSIKADFEKSIILSSIGNIVSVTEFLGHFSLNDITIISVNDEYQLAKE